MWVMLLVPLVYAAAVYLRPRQLQLLGAGLILAAVSGVLIIIGYEMATWYAEVPAELHHYVIQRILFVIGTRPEFPVVQILMAGIGCWFIARRSMRPPFREDPTH
jgi:hypothetical protein